MNRKTLAKVCCGTLAVVLLMGAMTVCGKSLTKQDFIINGGLKTVDLYFDEGVYTRYLADETNPDKSCFFIFNGDGTGSIENGNDGTASYMEYGLGKGKVNFKIGSIDPVDEKLTVKSFENGCVTGSFEDGPDFVFEPLENVDVKTFDAVNYVRASKGEDLIYTDANGWRVKYDPDHFVINEGGPMTSFVYKGESVGTNMITVTYTVGSDAQATIDKLGEILGDKAQFSEGIFPGTEDIPGYWVQTTPAKEGSGDYMTAVARDYMEGVLMFEVDGHMVEDEETSMEVSDALASIIDSLEFL